MNNAASLSIVIIIYNEQENLKCYLEYVRFADEIVVADRGSEEKTFEIAIEFTKKVICHEMQGFSD